MGSRSKPTRDGDKRIKEPNLPIRSVPVLERLLALDHLELWPASLVPRQTRVEYTIALIKVRNPDFTIVGKYSNYLKGGRGRGDECAPKTLVEFNDMAKMAGGDLTGEWIAYGRATPPSAASLLHRLEHWRRAINRKLAEEKRENQHKGRDEIKSGDETYRNIRQIFESDYLSGCAVDLDDPKWEQAFWAIPDIEAILAEDCPSITSTWWRSGRPMAPRAIVERAFAILRETRPFFAPSGADSAPANPTEQRGDWPLATLESFLQSEAGQVLTDSMKSDLRGIFVEAMNRELWHHIQAKWETPTPERDFSLFTGRALQAEQQRHVASLQRSVLSLVRIGGEGRWREVMRKMKAKNPPDAPTAKRASRSLKT